MFLTQVTFILVCFQIFFNYSFQVVRLVHWILNWLADSANIVETRKMGISLIGLVDLEMADEL